MSTWWHLLLLHVEHLWQKHWNLIVVKVFMLTEHKSLQPRTAFQKKKINSIPMVCRFLLSQKLGNLGSRRHQDALLVTMIGRQTMTRRIMWQKDSTPWEKNMLPRISRPTEWYCIFPFLQCECWLDVERITLFHCYHRVSRLVNVIVWAIAYLPSASNKT